MSGSLRGLGVVEFTARRVRYFICNAWSPPPRLLIIFSHKSFARQLLSGLYFYRVRYAANNGGVCLVTCIVINCCRDRFNFPSRSFSQSDAPPLDDNFLIASLVCTFTQQACDLSRRSVRIEFPSRGIANLSKCRGTCQDLWYNW